MTDRQDAEEEKIRRGWRLTETLPSSHRNGKRLGKNREHKWFVGQYQAAHKWRESPRNREGGVTEEAIEEVMAKNFPS